MLISFSYFVDQNWLSDHPYAKRATQFSVSTTIARGAQKINGEGGDGVTVATYFLPAPGRAIILIFPLVDRRWLRRVSMGSNKFVNFSP